MDSNSADDTATVDSATVDSADGAGPVEPAVVSRRTLLVAGAAVLVAAGGGVAVGFIEHVGGSTAAPPPVVPPSLLAALATERQLLAQVAAALPATSPRSALRTTLQQLHHDHLAHERVLAALVADDEPTAAPKSTSDAPTPRARPLGRAALRTSEAAAGVRAAELATALTGRAATVLASIAACEATHAELLS